MPKKVIKKAVKKPVAGKTIRKPKLEDIVPADSKAVEVKPDIFFDGIKVLKIKEGGKENTLDIECVMEGGTTMLVPKELVKDL